MKSNSKMKGVKAKNVTPELVSGNKDVVAAARKGRKSGGKADMKVKGDMAKGRADRACRACRASGGKLTSSDWTAAQGPGQKP